ncbi:hypothetical protein [Halomonas cerina]|uniref:Putative SOS response-associated peptidase YedK n=1 Tax=Halomonas cerina TaxID=447424 RepID=A0A839VJB2_9GAMM|nr:hypothetical protein [Halomonas cerina]MBB3192476.1 putative SOS response-associated peptidase YedK [Halomonas cerina]
MPGSTPALTKRDAIRAAVRHLDADVIKAWPVWRRVNRVANEGAELVELLPVR